MYSYLNIRSARLFKIGVIILFFNQSTSETTKAHKQSSPDYIIPVAISFSRYHLKYAYINQAIISIVINVIINAAITWFYFRTDETVPLFGLKSVSMDIVQANFYFTFYTCFFITRAVYGASARRSIQPIIQDLKFLQKWPKGYFYGSIVLGIAVSIVFTPLIVAGFLLFGTEQLTLNQFILFKAIWGGVMALIWAPIFTLIALQEAKHIEVPPRSIWQVMRGFCV